MALGSATITYDLSDMTGTDFDSRRTKVWVSTNVPDETVIDTDGDQIRLGSGNGTVNSDGTGEVTVWVPGVDSNPASWQTYVHVDYPDRHAARNGRKTRTFGPFTITASADLADLVDEQAVEPTYAGTLVAELEAIRDEAIEITGIDSTDSAVAALVETAAGPLTQAALSATYAPVADPEFTGTLALPGGGSGEKRQPVNGSVTIDGSTLPAGTADKVAYAFSSTFKGGFTAEAGYGAVNPGFLFGSNFFHTSGSTAGDLDGINDVYGALAEWHTYTPGAALVKQYGMQVETAVETSATGATVTDLMTFYAKAPQVKAGTVTDAITFRFDQPETSGAGTITGKKLGLWGRGAALFEGLTPNAQGSRKGVWIGGGAASGGDPAVELADGTNTWRIDNTSGELRFLKAGVSEVLSLDMSGNMVWGNLATGSQATMRTLLVTGDGSKTAQGRLTVYSNATGTIPAFFVGFLGQTADLTRWQDSTNAIKFAIGADGTPQWASAALAQTTVGAAGPASALPATPTKYLKVKDSAGTTYVIPAYAAS